MNSPKVPITLPETIILSSKETDDGQTHEALYNVVWFSSESERARNKDVAATFERELNGRKIFGGEVIYYLD